MIKGFTVALEPRALGLKLLAYVFVSEIKPLTREKTGPRLARLPSVEEVHRVAGKDCFLLKVRVADTGALTRLLDQIGSFDSVGAVETTIVLETYLERPPSSVTVEPGRTPTVPG